MGFFKSLNQGAEGKIKWTYSSSAFLYSIFLEVDMIVWEFMQTYDSRQVNSIGEKLGETSEWWVHGVKMFNLSAVWKLPVNQPKWRVCTITFSFLPLLLLLLLSLTHQPSPTSREIQKRMTPAWQHAKQQLRIPDFDTLCSNRDLSNTSWSVLYPLLYFFMQWGIMMHDLTYDCRNDEHIGSTDAKNHVTVRVKTIVRKMNSGNSEENDFFLTTCQTVIQEADFDAYIEMWIW